MRHDLAGTPATKVAGIVISVKADYGSVTMTVDSKPYLITISNYEPHVQNPQLIVFQLLSVCAQLNRNEWLDRVEQCLTVDSIVMSSLLFIEDSRRLVRCLARCVLAKIIAVSSKPGPDFRWRAS